VALNSNERETIINWNSGENMASVFTAEPRVWAQIERLPEFKLIRTESMGGEVVCKEFELPKACVRFGKNGLMIGRTKAVSQKQREQGKELARRKGVKAIP
jgi:hypothetical protein